MSCKLSVAFVFGRPARCSGEIEIGLLSSALGKRGDDRLLSSTTKQVLSRRPQGRTCKRFLPSQRGWKADHYAPGRPSLLPEPSAAGTRLCRANCRGLCMMGPKIIDPKHTPVPLHDIIRKGR